MGVHILRTLVLFFAFTVPSDVGRPLPVPPPAGERNGGCDFAGRGACLWDCCWGVGTPPPTRERCGCVGPFRSVRPRRPHPFPPPAGEGAAHKGGRRGRTRRDRNVEMTAAVGVCERFYCSLAVTFSLFRHPPRGGSADATFPRWGKEGGLRICRTWCLSLVLLCGTPRTAFPTGRARIRRTWQLVFGAAAGNRPRAGRCFLQSAVFMRHWGR